MCDASAWRPKNFTDGFLKNSLQLAKTLALPTKSSITKTVEGNVQQAGDLFANRQGVKDTEASYKNNALYGTAKPGQKQFSRRSILGGNEEGRTVLGA